MANPSSIGERLIRALGTGPDEIGDERAYLQDRVRLYTKTLFFLLGGFWVFLAVMLTLGVPGRALSILTKYDRIVHLVVAVLFGIAWAYTRAGARPTWVLHAIETVGTIKLCWATQPLVWHFPEAVAPELLVLLASSFVLIVRAAIVPSTVVRTVLVCVVALSPLAYAALVMRASAGGDLPYEFRIVLRYRVVVWAVIGTACTAVISHVVYGLAATVRDAMRVGQYRLERRIGEGAMGIVYEAKHQMLQRPTAIKVLPPERAGLQAITRFEREVVHMSRLQHPATVAIWDFGRTPQGLFYYAMELLDGVTLERLVERDGPQPPGRVAHILQRVAESLAEAHGASLVHRDVKPANVMICDRGGVPDTVKVLDFGLVKELAGASQAGLTQADALIGTPLYMSPEAITAPTSVDGRSDLYGLGATGYYLLTGTPVFRGATVVEVCSHHLHTPPQPPSERLGQHLPPALEAVILQCLAKAPTDRPPSARELADRLAEMLDGLAWRTQDARRWWSDWRTRPPAETTGGAAATASTTSRPSATADTVRG